MDNSAKIQSAGNILAGLVAVRDRLDEATVALNEVNALVALDPSGEPEELEAVIDALIKVKNNVSLEVYRWDTYLDNRE
jgi:hypothetical protein